MGLADRASSRRSGRVDAAAREAWLHRFGDEPPAFARQLLDRLITTGDGDDMALQEAAESLGVLRAQRGHAVAGLVEDLTALRALAPTSDHAGHVVDAALAAAMTAYVDELTAILEARATRDPLTGLPNRAAFTEALQHEVAAAARTSAPALLLVDLDGFKGVNDTDGHLAGDAVLVGVAELLRAQVRGGDLPCRLGGDEFAVVLPRTTHQRAVQVARRLLEASRTAPDLASPHARVHLSIGVGWLPQPSHPDDLIAVTDVALYAVKGRGGDDIALSQQGEARS